MSDAIVTAPPAPKSWVQTFVERAKGTIEKAEPKTAVSYVREAGSTAGDYAVEGIVGGLLGTAHAKFGLDSRVGPVDGLIAGFGALAAVGLSGYFPQAATYARKIGSSSFGIYSFRKSFGAIKHAPLAGANPNVTRVAATPTSGSQVAGEEDPIEKAAKGLG